jgi:hypothetical protein
MVALVRNESVSRLRCATLIGADLSGLLLSGGGFSRRTKVENQPAENYHNQDHREDRSQEDDFQEALHHRARYDA